MNHMLAINNSRRKIIIMFLVISCKQRKVIKFLMKAKTIQNIHFKGNKNYMPFIKCNVNKSFLHMTFV